MITDKDEFDSWCEDFLENPFALQSETSSRFTDMCIRGNPYAKATYDRMRREDENPPAERKVRHHVDHPLSTVGDIEEEEAPRYRGIVSVEGDYPSNWEAIAADLKSRKRWRCELCAFQKLDSSLVQVHHIDGDKPDNKPSNLQVLCAKCHGDKHASPPLWAIGTSESAMAELMGYHQYLNAKAFASSEASRRCCIKI